jgi:hypothetical protein
MRGDTMISRLDMRGYIVLRTFSLEHPSEKTVIYKGPNLIVNSGRDAIIDFLLSPEANKGLYYIQWGTSNSNPALTDTSVTGGLPDRILSTPVRNNQKITYTDVIVAMDAPYTNKSISEAGIFFRTPSTPPVLGAPPLKGGMFARVTFPTVNMGTDKGIELEWTFDFSKQ